MFRALDAVLRSDKVRIALAGAAIVMAFKVLTQVAEERTDYLAHLERSIENRRAELASIPVVDGYMDEHKAPSEYPAADDLDPLGRGE